MLKALFGNLAPLDGHRGWPRVHVDEAIWRQIGTALREGKLELLAEWGETDGVQCVVRQPSSGGVYIASLAAPSGAVPSLAQFHPPALRLERAMVDLFDLRFIGLPDPRPWLDHGRWPLRHPLAAGRRSRAPTAMAPYPFLAVNGPSLHQVPVGPVHAGVIEPGHFRITASGETVVRLEQRLGYVHRGIERLLAAQRIDSAARIAARASGDSTVAYSLAFARAVELALGVDPPPRAQWLRAIMSELERLANHLGDIGAVCNDAAFALMHAECGILREATLRVCAQAFGHRLMMDRVIPGGVGIDLGAEAGDAVLALTRRLEAQFPELIELYENTSSLQDRTVGSGVLTPALAAQFAAGGYVGRASGRAFDTRTALPYPPYDALPIALVTRSGGDVDARVWIRILEAQESLRWLKAALCELPDGSIHSPLPPAPIDAAVEATVLVEGFRGDVLAYVRIDPDLSIERCHLRDPSWFQWPLLEAAIDGNIIADFPLCNKSFNCSYAGHDM